MKAFTKTGDIVNVYCGLWTCKRCAKLNARLWAWRVRLHVENSGGDAYFWTLTLRGSVRTVQEGFEKLPVLWDALRKIVQRKIGKWSYCAFVEGQPKRGGMPHFHIISLVKAPYRIKDMAMDAGFGFQAVEVKITSPKASQYVAKYASKQHPATPKHFRRVRSSQDWAKLPPFDGDPLLVQSSKETVAMYIIRVSEETGLPEEELYERWRTATNPDAD